MGDIVEPRPFGTEDLVQNVVRSDAGDVDQGVEERMMSTGGQTDVAAPDDAEVDDTTRAASATESTDPGRAEAEAPEPAGSEVDPELDSGSDSDVGLDSDVGSDPESDSDDGAEGGSRGGRRPSRRGSSVQELEEEGDVAADYLEELLDIVDVDGDIDIDVENGRASLAIVAESGNNRSLRRLVGSNGEVLEALQELTRLAVQASTGDRSRLMLDIAGHRAARRQVLTDKATEACAQVKSSGEALKMSPMTAFERKIVHDVVADAGLNSESEGVEPNRCVVILPA